MKKLFCIVFITMFFGLVLVRPSVQANDENLSTWPMFGHDVRRTCQSEYNLDAHGIIKWKYENNGPIGGSPIIGLDGAIIFGSRDKYVYSINSDGTPKWKFKTDDEVYSTPGLSSDGIIYIGSRDNYLYAINPDGKLAWRFKTNGGIDSSPLVDHNGIIYFGSKDCHLYALNQDGSLKWRYKTQGAVNSSPAKGINGIIYFGSCDNYIYALNQDGSLKWKYITNDDVDSSPVIGSDGTIYIGSSDRYLYALNSDSTLKWKYDTFFRIGYHSPAISKSQTIYFLSKVLNSNGLLQWQYSYSMINTAYNITVHTEQPLITSDGTIFKVVSENRPDDTQSIYSTLYSFNEDGSVKWRKKLNHLSYSSPVIGKDKSLYVCSKNIVYCFGNPGDQAIVYGSINDIVNNHALAVTITTDEKNKYIFEKDEPYYFPVSKETNSIVFSSPGYYSLTIGNIFDSTQKTIYKNYKMCPHSSLLIFEKDTIIDYSLCDDTNYSCSFISGELPHGLIFDDSGSKILGNPISPGASKLKMKYVNIIDNHFLYTDISIQIHSNSWPMVGQNRRRSAQSKTPAMAYGNVVWKKKYFYNKFKDTTAPVLSNNGVIYVPKSDYLCALYPNGHLLWTFHADDIIESSSLVGQDGTIYFRTEYNLYAINADGSLKWNYRINDNAYYGQRCSPILNNDGTVVYAGSDDNCFYAFNSSDGSIKWKYHTQGEIYHNQAIDSNGTIYLTSFYNDLHALSPDGDCKWNYHFETQYIDSPVVGHNGSIYVPNYKKLYAFNPDGTVKWLLLTKGEIESTIAVDSEDNIFFCENYSYQNYINALTPDGDLKWKYKTGEAIISSSPVLDSDGTIYFTSGGIPNKIANNLIGYYFTFAINKYGELKWKYRYDNNEYLYINYYYIPSPIIDSNGTLYVLSHDSMYSFGINHGYGGICGFTKDIITENPVNVTISINNGQSYSYDLDYYALELEPKTYQFVFSTPGYNSLTVTNNIVENKYIENDKYLYPLKSSLTFEKERLVKYTFCDENLKISCKPNSNINISGLTYNDLEQKLSGIPLSNGNDVFTMSYWFENSLVAETEFNINIVNNTWSMRGQNSRHTGQSDYGINTCGLLKWRSLEFDTINSSPAIGLNGIIYLGCNFLLYALDPYGSSLWCFKAQGLINSSPAIATDSTIYFGSDDSYIYALDKEGKLKWKYKTDDKVVSSPVIDQFGTIYIGSNDEYLYSINPNGTLKWRYKTDDSIVSSPAVDKDRNIYVGSNDNYLYAINADGTMKWRFKTDDDIVSSPAIDNTGIIYVGSNDNYVYAINTDGTMKWRFKTDDNVISSPAIDNDNDIYIGSNDNFLYAINNNDGSLKWKFDTQDDILSSPAIDNNGVIYVGSNSYYFYAINIDGTTRWKNYSYDDMQSSPAIGSDGTIYFRNQAFGIPKNSTNIYGEVKNISTGESLPVTIVTNTGKAYSKYYPYIASDYSISVEKEVESITFISEGYHPFTFKTNNIPTGKTINKNINMVPLKIEHFVEKDVDFEFALIRNLVNTDYDCSINIEELPPGINFDTANKKLTGVSHLLSTYQFTVKYFNEDKFLETIFIYGVYTQGWSMSDHDSMRTGQSEHNLNAFGIEKWRFNPDDPYSNGIELSSISISSNGIIYISSQDWRLYAINPSGSLKWKYKTNGYSSPASIASDGTIYFYSKDYLYAVKPDGTLKWRVEVKWDYRRRSSIRLYGDTIYIGSYDGNLFAFNSNGTLKWTFSIEESITSLSVSQDGDIYIGSYDDYLYSIDPDGNLKWKLFIENLCGQPVIDFKGTVYVSSAHHTTKIFAINSEGTVKWQYQGYRSNSDPLISITKNGTIIVISSDKSISALNHDGTCKWQCKVQTDGYISSKPVISNDGKIIFGDSKGAVYVISENDGALIWKYNTSGAILATPAIASDGTLYVISTFKDKIYNDDCQCYYDDSTVFAFGIPDNSGIIYGNTNDIFKDVYSPISVSVDNSEFSKYENFYSIALEPGTYSLSFYSPDHGVKNIYNIPVIKNEVITPKALFVKKIFLKNQNVNYRLCEENSCRYELIENQLPQGLQLDKAQNRITGNSSTYGIYDFKMQYWENDTMSYERDFEFIIAEKNWKSFGSDSMNTRRSAYKGSSQGIVRWMHKIGDQVWSSPVIGLDDTVYIGASDELASFDVKDNYLYAFTPEGKIKWKYLTNEACTAPAIDNSGKIYISSITENDLYSIDFNGNFNWNYRVGPKGVKSYYLPASPNINSDGNVIVGSYNNLYCFNQCGKLVWKIDSVDDVYHSAIDSQGLIYIICNHKSLISLNSDGTVRWRNDLGFQFTQSSPSIDSDGTIYILSDNYLNALYPDGSVKWKFEIKNFSSPELIYGSQSSPAVGNDGTIYFGCDNKYIYAINSDGSLKWDYKTGDSVRSSPALDTEDTVYIGSNDSYFYSFNSDGALNWRYKTGGEINSSPAIGMNGTVYVGSNDGYLYAFGDSDSLAIVRGEVKNLLTDEFINSVIKINNGDEFKSENEYARSLLPGVYSFIFSAEGFYPLTINNVLLKAGDSIFQDIKLSPMAINQFINVPVDQNLSYSLYDSSNCTYSVNNGELPPGVMIDDETCIMKVNFPSISSYNFSLNINSQDNENTIERIFNIDVHNKGWHMIGHDPLHTGQSKYTANAYAIVKWIYSVNDSIKTSPVMDEDGTIYVGAGDTCLYALSKNGTLKWKYKTNGSIHSTPAIRNNLICFGSKDNNVYAINSEGSPIWSFETGNDVISSPAFDSDNTIYIGSSDMYLYAINSDGTLKWKSITEEAIVASPAVGPDGNIYITSKDKCLYAFNGKGELNWKFMTGGSIESSPSIGFYGTIYLGSTDHYLYAIDSQGNLKWKYDTEAPILSSPATGSDGNIFISSSNTLYAVTINGLRKWKFMASDKITSSPAIDQAGKLYIGTQDSYIYSINSENGDMLWRHTTGNEANTAPSIGMDGSVSIASFEGKLFNFGTQTENAIIYGSIKDKISKEYLSATITVNNSQSYFNEKDNSYAIEIEPGNHTLTFSSPGYGSLTININFSKKEPKLNNVFLYPVFKTYISKGDDFYFEIEKENSNPCIDFELLGKLPTGLKIDPLTRMISGKAIDTGNFEFTVRIVCENQIIFDRLFNIGVFTDSWSMKGHDIQHTGQSEFPGMAYGILNWDYSTDYYIVGSPAVASDGSIIFGSKDAFIYSVNPNGTINWRFKTGNGIESSPAISSDGTIYIGSNDSYLYAIVSSGLLKWKFMTNGRVTSSPVVDRQGDIYFGSTDHNFYAVNSDGVLKYSFKSNGDIHSSPSIDYNGTIYFGSNDFNLYAINKNGELKWKFSSNGKIYSSPSIGNDGTIYFGSDDNFIYALNNDGTLKWKIETLDDVRSTPAIGKDNTIYTGSLDGFVYAINIDGTLKWKYQSKYMIYSSPAISSSGIIYISSCSKRFSSDVDSTTTKALSDLFALYPNGKLKWQLNKEEQICSSPVIGSDGTLYIGIKNSLHAFKLNNKTAIEGDVTDILSNGLLSGVTITIRGKKTEQFLINDYFYYILDSGFYDIKFSKNNYQARIIENIYLENGSAYNFNIKLPGPDFINGDINLNGRIDIDDIIQHLQILAGLNPENVYLHLDFSSNSQIDLKDIIGLFYYLSND